MQNACHRHPCKYQIDTLYFLLLISPVLRGDILLFPKYDVYISNWFDLLGVAIAFRTLQILSKLFTLGNIYHDPRKRLESILDPTFNFCQVCWTL